MKIKNSKKEKDDKNEDKNNIEENKEKVEKEIIKYINGNYKEILDENPEKTIFKFNNGDIFQGEMDENNCFITGKFKHEELEIDIFIKILLIY